jgi:hypothetical protein
MKTGLSYRFSRFGQVLVSTGRPWRRDGSRSLSTKKSCPDAGGCQSCHVAYKRRLPAGYFGSLVRSFRVQLSPLRLCIEFGGRVV